MPNAPPPLLLLLLLAVSSTTAAAALQAGVSTIDATMPVGTPLAGYNYPPRRNDKWPLPQPGLYTTYMNGSVGVRDANMAKALVLDTGSNRICFVTMDAIGADGPLMYIAWTMARAEGFTIPFDKVMLHGSHSHSGPGAISASYLFALAPATDILSQPLQLLMASKLSQVMLAAERALQPAKLGLTMQQLIGFTHNRRHDSSEWYDKIDPNIGIMRVDTLDDTPLATVWNFAVHGICFDAPNLNFSSDIMGAISASLEDMTGAPALFINSDAGDINPVFGELCLDAEGNVDLHGGPVVAEKIWAWRNATPTFSDIEIDMAAITKDFGETSMNLTLARLANCTVGGPLDLCSLCTILHCDANLRLSSNWIENTPKFSAVVFRLDASQPPVLMVSIPGEALVELGWDIRNETMKQFQLEALPWLLGYTNDYMGYFSPVDEYDAGGYESILTLWGVDTADQVARGCLEASMAVMQLAGLHPKPQPVSAVL